jgi:hypothetical protein
MGMKNVMLLRLSSAEVELRSSMRNLVTPALCLCLLFATEAPAQQQAITEIVDSNTATFTTFDAPGAGTGADQGTYAHAINTAGIIAGDYLDASNVHHGFTRAAKGKITEFNAPGGGSGAYQGTFAYAISTAGDITGYDADASNVYHGFVRYTNGSIRMLRAQARAPIRAPAQKASTERGTLREPTSTRAMCGTDSCAIPTAR